MSLMRVTEHVLTGIVSVAVSLSIVHLTRPADLPTGIVTIDATEAVMAFISDGRRDMPEEAYKAEVAKFQDRLAVAVQDIAAEHNVIVVNSAVVLGGAPDITPTIIERVTGQ